jgi:3-hydroxyisobutyrate dehydrogenase-like beta-hydroxyacid dehydrogenase
MDKTVGLVGLGIMGTAIARNLVDRGWRVIGFDIDPARRAELSRDNVSIADNAAHVARDAPVIMTSLPDPAAVADVARAMPIPVSRRVLSSNSARSASPTSWRSKVSSRVPVTSRWTVR